MMIRIFKNLKQLILIFIGTLFLVPIAVSAHEAYVLPRDYFWQEEKKPFSAYAVNALKNPHNLLVAFYIIAGVLVLLSLNFLFRRTGAGQRFSKFLEKFSPLGPIFVRVAIAAAFFFGARSNAFLGPELPISMLPAAQFVKIILEVSSVMILFGFLTELAALTGLIIFTISFFIFGLYLMTYLNYLGELIVLFLFGSRQWSVDQYLFGSLKRILNWKKYESSIVRIFYGSALSYAAVTIKFLHPELTLRVINEWHLLKFHWLFPSDPLLVVFGGGLAELAIGLFIIFGFEMRLTVLISLFYITLSLLYFRELVWPHILLYGISLNLIVQPEIFTLDSIFFGRKRTETKAILTP